MQVTTPNRVLELEPHELARILLDRAGISNGEIAKALGVTPPLVSGVVRRQFRSARVEEYIANRLNLSREFLFPTDKPTRIQRRCEPRYPEGHEMMGDAK